MVSFVSKIFFIKTQIRVFSILLFLPLLNIGVYAQSSVGFDVSFNNDLFSLKDEGQEIIKSKRINLSQGICYRYKLLKQNIVLSSGLTIKRYKTSISFSKTGGQITSNSNIAILLPLIFEKPIRISKKWSYTLGPFVGITPGWMLSNSNNNSIKGIVGTINDTLTFSSINTIQRKLFFLSSLGLSFDFKLTSNISSSISTAGNFGFLDLIEDKIFYNLNNKNYNANQKSTGSFLSYLSLKLFYHSKAKTEKYKTTTK